METERSPDAPWSAGRTASVPPAEPAQRPARTAAAESGRTLGSTPSTNVGATFGANVAARLLPTSGMVGVYAREATVVIESIKPTGKTPDLDTGTRSAEAPPPNEPIRMHVQWRGRQADIWLGLDAAQAHRLPELAGTIIGWLRASRHSLGGLVCNGKAWSAPVRTSHQVSSAVLASHRIQGSFDDPTPILQHDTGETP